jgi:hypothetical protein
MVEGAVYSALQSLVNNRCYPLVFPQPREGIPEWPAIRYTVVSSVNEASICGTDSVDTDDTLMQLDIVAKTLGAAIVLRDQVISAMMGLSPPAVRVGSGFQTFDEETRTYRVTLDYLFSASSVAPGSP